MRCFLKKILAYFIHLFTASGIIVALLAINAIYEQQTLVAFWLMGIAILIDAVDGTLARWLKVKEILPKINGTLLDNIVDYVNYVVVPACFVMTSALLPESWRLVGAACMLLSSSYQFCQIDAKTIDHFFKGFPSYWNIAIIYLYLLKTAPGINLAIIMLLTVLVFVPIKYIYPSRMDYVSNKKYIRVGLLTATCLWGVNTFYLVMIFPQNNPFLFMTSMGYLLVYTFASLYRTFLPFKVISGMDK